MLASVGLRASNAQHQISGSLYIGLIKPQVLQLETIDNKFGVTKDQKQIRFGF